MWYALGGLAAVCFLLWFVYRAGAKYGQESQNSALAEAVKKDYERMAKINAANSNLSRNERMQRVRDKLQK